MTTQHHVTTYLSDEGEKVLVELEDVRVVLGDLPDTVQELDEDGRVVRWREEVTKTINTFI